jgi:hypothetical protein
MIGRFSNEKDTMLLNQSLTPIKTFASSNAAIKVYGGSNQIKSKTKDLSLSNGEIISLPPLGTPEGKKVRFDLKRSKDRVGFEQKFNITLSYNS